MTLVEYVEPAGGYTIGPRYGLTSFFRKVIRAPADLR